MSTLSAAIKASGSALTAERAAQSGVRKSVEV